MKRRDEFAAAVAGGVAATLHKVPDAPESEIASAIFELADAMEAEARKRDEQDRSRLYPTPRGCRHCGGTGEIVIPVGTDGTVRVEPCAVCLKPSPAV